MTVKMFCILRQRKQVVHFVNFLINTNVRLVNAIRPYCYFVNHSSGIGICSTGHKGFLMNNDQPLLILARNKYDGRRKKKQGKYQDEESSDEEDELDDHDDDDDSVEKGAEIKTHSVKSLRIDAVLKATLGISRNKIEEFFYQNKLRVSGEIVQKKSQNVKLNDELDLIKGAANDHSDSIIVGRVKILKLQLDPDTGNILLKVWKCKSLKISNYEDRNAWREPAAEE